MTKTKLLTILVIALTVLNLVVLGMVFFKKPGGRKMRPPKHEASDQRAKDRFQQMMDFDEAQTKVFATSKKEHRVRTRALEKELRELSNQFYHLGNSAEQLNERTAVLEKIQSVNHKIYKSNMQHFDDLRAVCTSEQLPKLDDFIDILINRNHKKLPFRKSTPKGRR